MDEWKLANEKRRGYQECPPVKSASQEAACEKMKQNMIF